MKSSAGAGVCMAKMWRKNKEKIKAKAKKMALNSRMHTELLQESQLSFFNCCCYSNSVDSADCLHFAVYQHFHHILSTLMKGL